jgi:hypothetical protein
MDVGKRREGGGGEVAYQATSSAIRILLSRTKRSKAASLGGRENRKAVNISYSRSRLVQTCACGFKICIEMKYTALIWG